MMFHGKYFHSPGMYHTHALYIVIILYEHEVVLYMTISTDCY